MKHMTGMKNRLRLCGIRFLTEAAPDPEEFVLGIAALLQTSADAINLKELSSCGSYRV